MGAIRGATPIRRESQEKLILRTLQNGGKVNPIMALNQYGCMRLAAVVCILRKKGWNIKTNTITRGHTSFAEYELVAQS
jgi:hypothetical protein